MMDVDHHQHSNFSDAILSRLQDGTNISAYSFMANLLAEIICPDVIPTMPWPDEDFLKHTVERFVDFYVLFISIYCLLTLVYFLSELYINVLWFLDRAYCKSVVLSLLNIVPCMNE